MTREETIDAAVRATIPKWFRGYYSSRARPDERLRLTVYGRRWKKDIPDIRTAFYEIMRHDP